MAVSRVGAIQGQTVRLKLKFKKDNVLTNPYSLGTVQIKDPSSTLLSTLTPILESTGIYYVDYPITSTATSGWYSDIWNDIVYSYGWIPQSVTGSFYVQSSTWWSVTPNVCRVYEHIYYQDGTPRVGSKGYATISVLPYDYQYAVFSNPTDDGYEAVSNSAGYIYWDMIWGSQVAFEIDDAGLGKEVIIPEQASARLSDLEEVE